MTDTQNHTPGGATGKPPGDRLESWKRISNYLNRDIRTLRRWEKNEALPIHRHMHDSQASVYAYKTELDAWLTARSAAATKTPRTRNKAINKHLLIGISIAVVAMLIGLLRLQNEKLELPFAARDWILITKFENRTGEEVFDGTLEYALQRELSNSQFVNVVSRQRISDSVALMKLPADTVISAEIGREISLRDGGIKALVTGRIEKLGENYILSAGLIEPISGVTVTSFSQTANGEGSLATAIQELANDVRGTLGETLDVIEPDAAALEKVTTPSLRALQLYSQADAIFIEHKSQAHQLLQQALEIDPDFASAHVLLGYVYKGWGQRELSDFHYQRAMDLADTTSERERYFIQSSYYSYQEFDQSKATNLLELLVRKYPDHFWAISRLIWIHYGQNQPLRALPYSTRIADLRPNNFFHQLLAVRRILATNSNQDYLPYLERAKMLVSQDWERVQISALTSQQAWLNGNISESYTEAGKLRDEVINSAGEFNYLLAWQAAAMHLALGRLQEAKLLLKDFDVASELRSLFHLATGNLVELDTYFANAEASHKPAILLARLGRTAEAEAILQDPAIKDRVIAPFLLQTWEGLAKGELAFARGQYDAAINHLTVPFETPPMWPTAYYFLGLETMANALVELGNNNRAIEVLEHSKLQRAESIFWPGASMFWVNNQLRLMALYRQAEQPKKAEQIAKRLRVLLEVADADHPVLIQLDRYKSGSN